MSIELLPVAPEEQDALSDIFNEYLTSLGEFRENGGGPESVSDYPHFTKYWKEKGRYPFFIACGVQIVGFVLLRTLYSATAPVFQVAEFYIKPSHQRCGFGSKAVSLMWNRYCGAWELEVLLKNSAAVEFWSKCSSVHAVGEVRIKEVNGSDGPRYKFNFDVASAS